MPIEFADTPHAGLTSLTISRIQLNLLVVVEYAFRIELDGSHRRERREEVHNDDLEPFLNGPS
jgi:hypothetical protein